MGTIAIRPVTAAIGAEIEGADVAGALSDQTVAEIRRALLEHLVVFFRGQPDSIAFCDNRCVQHYAVADYSERRVMHRVTIDGPPAG
jgi:alpha-ketoglutarate-dependent taurine dioxygenase